MMGTIKRRRPIEETAKRVERAVLRNGMAGCTTAWLSDTLGFSHMHAWRLLQFLQAKGRIVSTNLGGEGNRWLHRVAASRIPEEEHQDEERIAWA